MQDKPTPIVFAISSSTSTINTNHALKHSNTNTKHLNLYENIEHTYLTNINRNIHPQKQRSTNSFIFQKNANINSLMHQSFSYPFSNQNKYHQSSNYQAQLLNTYHQRYNNYTPTFSSYDHSFQKQYQKQCQKQYQKRFQKHSYVDLMPRLISSPNTNMTAYNQHVGNICAPATLLNTSSTTAPITNRNRYSNKRAYEHYMHNNTRGRAVLAGNCRPVQRYNDRKPLQAVQKRRRLSCVKKEGTAHLSCVSSDVHPIVHESSDNSSDNVPIMPAVVSAVSAVSAGKGEKRNVSENVSSVKNVSVFNSCSFKDEVDSESILDSQSDEDDVCVSGEVKNEGKRKRKHKKKKRKKKHRKRKKHKKHKKSKSNVIKIDDECQSNVKCEIIKDEIKSEDICAIITDINIVNGNEIENNIKMENNVKNESMDDEENQRKICFNYDMKENKNKNNMSTKHMQILYNYQQRNGNNSINQICSEKDKKRAISMLYNIQNTKNKHFKNEYCDINGNHSLMRMCISKNSKYVKNTSKNQYQQRLRKLRINQMLKTPVNNSRSICLKRNRKICKNMYNCIYDGQSSSTTTKKLLIDKKRFPYSYKYSSVGQKKSVCNYNTDMYMYCYPKTCEKSDTHETKSENIKLFDMVNNKYNGHEIFCKKLISENFLNIEKQKKYQILQEMKIAKIDENACTPPLADIFPNFQNTCSVDSAQVSAHVSVGCSPSPPSLLTSNAVKDREYFKRLNDIQTIDNTFSFTMDDNSLTTADVESFQLSFDSNPPTPENNGAREKLINLKNNLQLKQKIMHTKIISQNDTQIKNEKIREQEITNNGKYQLFGGAFIDGTFIQHRVMQTRSTTKKLQKIYNFSPELNAMDDVCMNAYLPGNKRKRKKPKIQTNIKHKINNEFCKKFIQFKPLFYCSSSPANATAKCYIIRPYADRDFETLVKLDRIMTEELMGDPSHAYNRNSLQNWTNTRRTKFHHWRTITCEYADNHLPIAFLLYFFTKRNGSSKYRIPVVNGDGSGGRRKVEKFDESSNLEISEINDTSYVELFWILVDEQHRRQGLARQLIDIMMLNAIREWHCSHFRLHCITSNTPALMLYRTLGFESHRLKNNYPAKKFQSHRMVKRL